MCKIYSIVQKCWADFYCFQISRLCWNLLKWSFQAFLWLSDTLPLTFIVFIYFLFCHIFFCPLRFCFMHTPDKNKLLNTFRKTKELTKNIWLFGSKEKINKLIKKIKRTTETHYRLWVNKIKVSAKIQVNTTVKKSK